MTSSVRPTRAAGRTAWLVVGGVLTAAILAFGGLTVWSWLAHQSATEEQTYLRPVSRIELEVGSGDVSLAPGPSGQVSVRRRLGWSLAKPLDRPRPGTATRCAYGAAARPSSATAISTTGCACPRT